MQPINLSKTVYGRTTYTKVIDTQFSELYTPVSASDQPTQISVEQFFDLYEQLFFLIPATGAVNSHQYLVKQSKEYLGADALTDTEQAYIDEINSLRQQLLEANINIIGIDEIA